jgi:hypothetical protein
LEVEETGIASNGDDDDQTRSRSEQTPDVECGILGECRMEGAGAGELRKVGEECVRAEGRSSVLECGCGGVELLRRSTREARDQEGQGGEG